MTTINDLSPGFLIFKDGLYNVDGQAIWGNISGQRWGWGGGGEVVATHPL